MKRLSDVVASLVEQALADVEMPAGDRARLEWEVIPFMSPDASVRWLVGVGLPVGVTGDYVMPFALLSDPHGRDEVARLARALYEAAARQAADAMVQATSLSGGNGKSPGGLVLP